MSSAVLIQEVGDNEFAEEIGAGTTVAVGTALHPGGRAAPRSDPSVRNYRTGLLPRVLTRKRSVGQGC